MKVQRTSMCFKSSFCHLEDAGGSWLGFCIWILIGIWSVLFDIPMFKIVVLYLDTEGEKNSHVLSVLIWGFGGHWRFLTGVWHFDLDLDVVTGLWYTHIMTFGPLWWFWRCKDNPCPLSSDFGLWWGLKVPDWGLPSWSWFEYGQWSLVQPWSQFRLFLFIFKIKRTSMSFKS